MKYKTNLVLSLLSTHFPFLFFLDSQPHHKQKSTLLLPHIYMSV